MSEYHHDDCQGEFYSNSLVLSVLEHTQTLIHQIQAHEQLQTLITSPDSNLYHISINMSSTSNVGDRRTYEDGVQVCPSISSLAPKERILIDLQRNYTDAELKAQKESERFEEGKENSHNATDPKDERSIANRLAAETKKEEDEEETAAQKDATLPVSSGHNNNNQTRQKHVPAYMRSTASSTAHQHEHHGSRSNKQRTYLMQPANTSNQDERK